MGSAFAARALTAGFHGPCAQRGVAGVVDRRQQGRDDFGHALPVAPERREYRAWRRRFSFARLAFRSSADMASTCSAPITPACPRGHGHRPRARARIVRYAPTTSSSVPSTRWRMTAQRSTWPRKRWPIPAPSLAPSIRPGRSAMTNRRRRSRRRRAAAQGGEGIVGDLGLRARDRGQEGRLPGIGQADEAGIGDELQAQPDPALLARPAGIGATRRLVGRSLVVGVAEAAVAAAQEHDALARPRRGRQARSRCPRPGSGADRDAASPTSSPAAPVRSRPMPSPPVLALEVLLIAEVDQGVQTVHGLEPDVAAAAAVAAVGAAELDELLAPERDARRRRRRRAEEDLALVEEFHGVDARAKKQKGAAMLPSPPLMRWRGGWRRYSAASGRRRHRNERAPAADLGNRHAPSISAKSVWSRPMPTLWPGMQLGAALAHDDVAGDDDLPPNFFSRDGGPRYRARCASSRLLSYVPWRISSAAASTRSR